MSDFQIQIGVDSRKAQTGVTHFTRSVSDSLKALRQFDSVSKSAFASLDKLGRTNLGSLAKSARGTAQALETLNKVKVSKALVTNLQTLQKALANFRFNANAMKAVPIALANLNRIRIDGRLVTSLNQIKAALVGFKGPPLAAVRNLNALVAGLAVANPARINAAAAALSRLNGLSLRVGRGSMPDFSKSTNSLRGFTSQMTASSSVANLLRSALAGVSAIALGRSVYNSGTAFASLQRTLGAVASSAGEVQDQLSFLQNLTGAMPISLDAVTGAYGKFAVAARLSGVTVGDTERIFAGFSTAFAAMGVGAETQERGFVALEQMMSKGKISSEELRQQLAEALPGAMNLLAESLDVSVAKLSKMLEAGEVTSDSLIKMSDLLKSRFGPSMAAAMNSSAAQIVSLQNSWTDLQRILFNSGFSSGLAAMAKQLSEVFRSDDAKRLAADLGAALGSLARGLSAVVKVLVDNRDAVRKFFDAFKIYAGVMAAAAALKVLGMSVGAVLPILTLTARSLSLLGKGLLLIASGGMFRAIADGVAILTKRLWLIPVAIGAALAALDQFANNGAWTDKAISFVTDFSKKLISASEAGFSSIMGAQGPFGDQFATAMKQADDFAKQIDDANLLNSDAMQRNAAREATNAAAKLSALTDAQQAVWDEVNAVGKANDEYQKQLVLLDAIAPKKGIDAAPWKKALAVKTLDDRNPAGALARDHGDDLANLRAKTGEQKALNDAQRDYNDLLKKGQDIGASGLAALQDYYRGVGRMTGEIGNGIERWTTSVGDFNDSIQNAIKDGIGGLSDELTNFVTGAESDFAGLARSILKTFVQISLNSLLKDMFAGLGMDGQTNGGSMADAALAKLANIGSTISTAMTNVYTAGLSINGLPVDGGLGPMSMITRAPLADIPGSSVAPRMPLATDRFPIEPGRALPAGWAATGPIGANTTAKTNRIGYVDPERFAPGITPNNGDLARAGESIGAGFTKVIAAGNNTTSFMRADGSTVRRDGTFAWRNNNPGNIEAGKFTASQPGYLPGGGRFAAFDTLEHGRAARENLLFNSPGYRNKTLEAAVAKYAPPSENNTRNYTDQLAAAARVSTQTRMSDMTAEQRRALMAKQEAVEGFRVGRETQLSPPRIDPATTQGIDFLNAKLKTIGTTATATAPAVDTMRAANQNLATASTMTGVQVQTAGTLAGSASPQFQQAGTSIQQAGMAASTAGSQAQAGASGVGGFGQGISSLLGPLASAIPGLGQFGGMIMQLLQSMMGGGGIGSMLGGLFEEGGYSTSPLTRASLPAGVWSNAPHYAEGTANTSGGMPAVLHPNEAVIPLTRGREIPVDLGNDNRSNDRSRERPVQYNTFNLNGIRDFDTFKRSKQQTQRQMLSSMRRAEMRA
ncbi:tape measure protein [Mesorhizobium sp. M0808]|uniref:tape measure protein n=1 Tax=Mesorhizobium sp. M0808 TaxID=2957002 RepID=UPI00333CA4DD